VSAFVLDASATAAWILPDEASAQTEQLYVRVRKQEVAPQVPNLWLWECGNLITSGVHSGRIAAQDLNASWAVVNAIRQRCEVHELLPPQFQAAMHIGVKHAISLYDAGYLWLAQSLRLPLLTLDARLAQACQQENVPTLKPEEI
jgi:predicted nucleic acid-binding protein